MEIIAIVVWFAINAAIEYSKKEYPNIPSRVVLALFTILACIFYQLINIVYPEAAISISSFTWLTFATAVSVYEYLFKLIKKEE